MLVVKIFSMLKNTQRQVRQRRMQTNCYCFYVFLYCDPVVIRIKTKWLFLKVILLFHFQPLLMSNDLRDIDCRSKENTPQQV